MAGFGEGKRVVLASAIFVAAVAGSLWVGRMSMMAPQRVAAVSATSDDDIYTGSILITPQRGDDCWQRYLDNLTGKIWDHGTVSCDAAALRSASVRPSVSPRLEAIAKAFRGH